MTIRSGFCRSEIYIVVSPKQPLERYVTLLCCIRINGYPTAENISILRFSIHSEHLFIFQYVLLDKERWLEQDNELLFEFNTTSQAIDIIECGVWILRKEAEESSERRNKYGLDKVLEDDDDLSYEFESNEVFEESEKVSR